MAISLTVLSQRKDYFHPFTVQPTGKEEELWRGGKEERTVKILYKKEAVKMTYQAVANELVFWQIHIFLFDRVQMHIKEIVELASVLLPLLDQVPDGVRQVV